MNMFISTWVLLVAGLVFALPMIHTRVRDHTDEDLDDLYDFCFSFRLLRLADAAVCSYELSESDQDLSPSSSPRYKNEAS